MIQIQFPKPAFKIKKENGKDYIFDSFRKLWLLLTEEEWVRQNFLQYMTGTMNYPSSLIAIEKEIQLGELKKRFDILVYDFDHHPWMLVECKARRIPLSEDVIQQVLRYNVSVPVHFLIITNGNYTYGWQKVNSGVTELDAMPVFMNGEKSIPEKL